MSSEYNYDASAQFFPFFVITLTSLVTLPLTYTLLRTPSDSTTTAQQPKHAAPSSLPPTTADIIQHEKAKAKRKERRTKRMIVAAVGWLTMAWMAYLMYTVQRDSPKVWDPYDILSVGLSATEKEINSRYRRLSVTMHPDKARPDESKNETLDTVNERWVEIVKAYKSLTDEETRNNYIQYGNPDGKQSTSFGIALPSLLVSEGNGRFVLLGYALLLGIALPGLVGKWWYGLQSKTREKIYTNSAGNMFREYKGDMNEADVLFALASANEFKELIKSEESLGRLEKTVLASGALSPKDTKRLQELSDSTQRKVLALLWAYLLRLDLGDPALEAEKFSVAPEALRLLEAFQSICLAYGITAPLLATYRLSQSLVQACPPASAAPLLQLPHTTSETVAQVESTMGAPMGKHVSLQEWMALPPSTRRTLAEKAGIASGQVAEADSTAKQLPQIKIEKAWFKVQGEKYIIGSSLVQLVIKARFLPPGSTNFPPVKAEDLDDIDPDEKDLAAQKKEPAQHSPPLAYAPYLARDRSPRWSVFLADARQGKIAVPPFTFTNFDKPITTSSGEPTNETVTLRCQFQAPPQPGEYKFQMHLLSDSYVGMDIKHDITLMVEDASKADEVLEEDEISEPEEDSIAGQMAALKGQPTRDPDAPKPERRRRRPAKEESDYESDTEGEEDEQDESETDTDTDTEDES